MRAGALFIAALGLVVLFAILAVRAWPRPPLAEQIARSTVIFDAEGRLLRLTLAADQQYRLWTPLERIAPELVEALLLHEDRHFYRHPGVNPIALLRAAFQSYTGGARQGGSTLSMQLARLLWQLNTRTPRGKCLQILRALALESRYSKRELLEAHLNLMPYGANIQGVGTASLIYFGKTADRLSLAEALSLVVIPQSPQRRAPGPGEPDDLRRARERLYAEWVMYHGATGTDAQAIGQPLRYRELGRLPFLAPHLTTALLQRDPTAREIHTTLDAQMQKRLERHLARYVERKRRLGVHNAVAMLVDRRDMAVKALVGSADFFDAGIEGQTNGAFAKRSPGSALKPFIYALALDQGLIHPLSMLKDAPTAFGAFNPENFDGRFMGPISAHDALIRSRNVPAVALSAQLARPGFYQFLRTAGISRMRSEQHYGLALALGGGEVSMEEMLTLYAMLANEGIWRPLRYRREAPPAEGVRLLSAQASWLTLDMLKDNPRPDEAALRAPGPVPVAWKTGTSWGFRDAWTVGSFGPYVLAVWVGHFDGRGNPAFVGVQAAAPLFFEIADALLAGHAELAAFAPPRPPGLTRIEVCSASGELPNAACPQRSMTWFIPGVSPIRVSNLHRRVSVDIRTGRQACPDALGRIDPATTRTEVHEYWPSDLQRLFVQAGMPRRPPPAAGDCAGLAAVGAAAPVIVSPLAGATYTLRVDRAEISPATPEPHTVPLQANAQGDVTALYWFVDDAFIGTARPGEVLLWAPARSGRYQVRVVDDHDRASTRAVEVAWLSR